MLTLLIVGLVIVIPLLLLVSFGWAPQQHNGKRPLEERKESNLRDESADEKPDDTPNN